jgi:uncharacterized protein
MRPCAVLLARAAATVVLSLGVVSAEAKESKSPPSITADKLGSERLKDDYRKGFALYQREDYSGARRLLLPLAKAGVVDAQYVVGRMYALGEGVNKDLVEAKEWISGVVIYYRTAAAGGDVDAQYQLGRIYLDTLGVDRNEAHDSTAKAALRGHLGAQYNLSKLLNSRKGEEELPLESAYWLRVAAEGGHVEAQYDLGYRLARGRGVERDSQQARLWLQRAEKGGHAEAGKALIVFGLTASK